MVYTIRILFFTADSYSFIARNRPIELKTSVQRRADFHLPDELFVLYDVGVVGAAWTVLPLLW